MKKNNKFSLTSGIIFFIIGLVLFTRPNTFVKFISYIMGGILIIIGLYKVTNYYIKDKNLKVVNRNEMAFGITSIILGIVFIFLADAIELLLRFIVGGYLIIIGLSKLLQIFYTTDRSNKFYALIVVGLIFILCGIYTVANSNLPLKIIGLFMMIYGIIDFISYFIYKDSSKDSIIENVNNIKGKNKTEVVEEVEFVEKKENKKGGRKK